MSRPAQRITHTQRVSHAAFPSLPRALLCSLPSSVYSSVGGEAMREGEQHVACSHRPPTTNPPDPKLLTGRDPP